MALTRKFLSALGIEADKVDEIIKAHTDTVDALKEERDNYKEQAEKSESLEAELKKANKQIEELSKEDSYKVKYEALKSDFDEYKKGVESEKTKDAKLTAYKELLKEIGISEKHINSVSKLAELDKINLDKEGKIEGIDDLKKTLSDEWADFIVKNNSKGAEVANPPANNGGKKTKEEIMAIKDTAERQKAMLENKDLFIN